ncbi:MAG: hypothetical protein H7A37_04055 [Chlamydiales bacterium]|nr:hypothetical protein [Chlamydiia bacterium]MCP5507459.1 hypothetical protein [Chlamydiales bacterium]
MDQLDGGGVVGETLHYALSIAMFGSALLVFLYLWRKGRLDMDQDPANKMMETDEDKITEKTDDDK